MKHVSVFASFLVPLARNFEYTKTPRASFLADSLRLPAGAPDAFTRTIKSTLEFAACCSFLRRAVAVRRRGANVMLGGVLLLLLSHFVHPNFDQYRLLLYVHCCCCCCSHINSLTKESVATQRCWSPRKIRKTTKKTKFGWLKIHETKKAHTR